MGDVHGDSFMNYKKFDITSLVFLLTNNYIILSQLCFVFKVNITLELSTQNFQKIKQIN